MVSVSAILLAVLKTLQNLLSMKKSLFEITADVHKIKKNIQNDLTFIFTELSQNVNSFL